MQREVENWITINGKHVPIFKQDSKRDTTYKAIAVSNENKKNAEIAKNQEIANQLNAGKVNKLSRYSTPKEIQVYYKNKYNISVDNSYFEHNNEPEFLIDSTKNFDKLYAEFPILKDANYKIISKDFDHEKLIPEEYKNTTALSKSDYKGEIWLNAWHFNRNEFPKIAEEFAIQTTKGKFPKNTSIYNVLVHELGHKVEIEIARSIGVSESELKYNGIAELIVKQSYKDMPAGMYKTIQRARNSISKYSGTNYTASDGSRIYAYEETFAEAISDYITNGSKAQPFSLKIVENIKSIINS